MRNRSGFMFVELLVVATVGGVVFLLVAVGIKNYTQQERRIMGLNQSRSHVTRNFLQLQKYGRLSTGCDGSDIHKLQCTVPFPDGTETVVYQYDPASKKLTHFRGPRRVWEMEGITEFTVCNGRDLVTGNCFDGGEVWTGTTMASVAPAGLTHFYRLKMGLDLKHAGETLNTFTIRGSFFARNATDAIYRWMPTEGGF